MRVSENGLVLWICVWVRYTRLHSMPNSDVSVEDTTHWAVLYVCSVGVGVM